MRTLTDADHAFAETIGEEIAKEIRQVGCLFTWAQQTSQKYLDANGNPLPYHVHFTRV